MVPWVRLVIQDGVGAGGWGWEVIPCTVPTLCLKGLGLLEVISVAPGWEVTFASFVSSRLALRSHL